MTLIKAHVGDAGLGQSEIGFHFLPFHLQIPLISFHLTQLSYSQPTWSLPLTFTLRYPIDVFICCWFYTTASLIKSQWLVYWNIFTHMGVLPQTNDCAGLTIRPRVIKFEFFLCVHYSFILISTFHHFQGQNKKPGTHSWKLSLLPSSLPLAEHLPRLKRCTYIMSSNPFNLHNI